jgi:hypothetical protein
MAIEDNKINIKVGMNTRGFQNGMKTVQGGFKKLNGAIGAFSAGFVGTQVFGIVKGLADMAGEAEKTELRFKRVFGAMSTSVSMFSSKLATDLGRVETDVKSGMVSFQAFFQGLGFGGKEAAGMSAKMQALSFDLASFFNIQDENAQKRFLAALAGSPEVLDQFGINLKQAALQTELYDMGIKSTVQNTDELTKTQGRLNIIMRAMTSNGIVGDAERTMDTWSNTINRTWSEIKDLGIAIGTMLLPVLKGFMMAVREITKGINALLGIEKEEVELNKKKKSEYESLTRILLSTEKGTQSYRLALRELTQKYPAFWNNIDTAKISQEGLAKAVAESSKQFDIQDDILSKKSFVEVQTKRVKELEEKLAIFNKEVDAFSQTDLTPSVTTTSQMGGNFPTTSTKKGETEEQRGDALLKFDNLRIAKQAVLNAAIRDQAAAQELLNAAINKTGLTYEQIFGLINGIKAATEEVKEVNNEMNDAEKQFLEYNNSLRVAENQVIKDKYALIRFTQGIQGKSLEDLREMVKQRKLALLEAKEMLENDKSQVGVIEKLREEISALTATISITLEVDEDATKEGLIKLIDVIRPITDAISQLWTQMLTPPDGTISKEEQKEKTMAAFGGIMVGLGQALVSLGMGALLANEGLKRALSGDGGSAIAMMAVGSGLIAFGKGKLQKAKDMASSRTAGGSANSGSGGGNFTGMMEAIQGEQVFRLAGNDLVTALNRTNNFQGAIGG